MQGVLSDVPEFAEKVVLDHPVNGLDILRDTSRPAKITTKKFRVVCAGCNNGWMSELEEGARPLITKMIQGHRFVMDQKEQTVLAKWCALKLIVSEHGPECRPTTPFEDRNRLMERGEIPDYFRIYIGAQRTKAGTGYLRRTAIGSRPYQGVPELGDTAANIQQTTFLLGKSFVHLNAVRVEGAEIEQQFFRRKIHKFGRLWPMETDRKKWPDKAIVNQSELSSLANSWVEVRNRPNVVWAGDLPSVG